jgi:hypothetical protein
MRLGPGTERTIVSAIESLEWSGRLAEPPPEGIEPREIEVHGEPTV